MMQINALGRASLSHRAVIVSLLLGGLMGLWTTDAHAQKSKKYKNLKVLQKDISRDDLMKVMRNFSFALGERCQYCHLGGDGRSFEGVEFEKDGTKKKQARFMMKMVNNLNKNTLPGLPHRSEHPVTMSCKTCHRGRPKPLLLRQELRLVLEESGVDSTVAHYRSLRENYATSGSYDFDEWEMNSFAEELSAEGKTDDAIAMYILNGEFFPESLSIKMTLAGLYEEKGEIAKAIEYYEAIQKIRPKSKRVQKKLEDLRK